MMIELAEFASNMNPVLQDHLSKAINESRQSFKKTGMPLLYFAAVDRLAYLIISSFESGHNRLQ